jgi:pimeloyl-ACP methyl ester carboxylesterase
MQAFNVGNFRTQKGQDDYYQAYEKTLMLWDAQYSKKYVTTSFGETHCLICGETSNPPLVLLHAASCGATIWYPNVKALSRDYAVYAIDLITEPSKSSLQAPIKGKEECAKWLDETVSGIGISTFYMCGLSIGGWNAANYASHYPQKVKKLVLLSPVQTFSKMYFSYFFKIIKMGFKPTRKSVEAYLGWGSQKETPLPDSVIDQFTISAMNINSNGVFPKMLKQEALVKLRMPVLTLFGENEFAFNTQKATDTAKAVIADLEIEIVKNTSHLLSVSAPEYVNERIVSFLGQ